MKTQALRALVVATTVFSLVAAPISFPLTAQAVNNEDISDQRRVVMSGLVDVLHEQVKLFQLVVIKHLEDRVAYLRAQLDE